MAGLGSLLLALWLQVLAPAVVLRVHTAPDLLRVPVLCGPTASKAADGAVALPQQESDCAHCPFCSPVAAPTLPIPAATIRSSRWRFAVWPLPPQFVSSSEPRHDGRPRAPPVLA